MVFALRLAAFVFVALRLTVVLGQDTPHTVSQDALRKWVQNLSHREFAIRRHATRELFRAGDVAVPHIRRAAQSTQVEVAERAIRILFQLVATGKQNTQRLARDTLTDLAQSSNEVTARRASRALQRHRDQLVAKLEQLGGRVTVRSGIVVSIYFDGSDVTDHDLRVLKDFPDVESLSLGSTNVGDDGMQYLKHLPKLDVLNLYRSQVGNRGLKYIKQCKSITWLPMGETNVTDAGLAHLSDMPQLNYLGLRGNNVTDDGLVHLKALTNLTGLYLGETKVTDAGLAHLSRFENMSYLRLHTMRVSDAGLPFLKGMKNLTRIDIYDTDISDAGARQLLQWFPNCSIVTKK